MPPQLIRTNVLPTEVQDAYAQAGAQLNFGLRMQKDIRAWEQRGDGATKTVFSFFRSGSDGDGAKELEFALPKFNGPPFASLFSDLAIRQRVLAEAYPNRVKLDLALKGSLVIGMGQASVYDNGITLHPVFGFPYLPGSSLKGITRRIYIETHHGNDEALALADQTFCDLFGCTGDTELEVVDETGELVLDQKGNAKAKAVPSYYKLHPAFDKDQGDRRGRLIFFDALPTSAPSIKVDIVNPHYKPYYEQAKAPADIYNPVPANFIAITGGNFSVVMALDRPKDEREREFDQGEAFARAREALSIALTEDGIGGKTTVGYGRFVDPEVEKLRVHKLEQAAKAEVAQQTKAGQVKTATVDEVAWVKAADIKPKKGTYKVNLLVISKAPKSSGGDYTFQPMVEELRGKISRSLFINIPFDIDEVILGAEITGVNWAKGLYAINGKTLVKSK